MAYSLEIATDAGVPPGLEPGLRLCEPRPGMGKGGSFLRAFGRVLLAVPVRFLADSGLVHASALAYTTLLALVPLLALMLAAAKGLGGTDEIESLLLARFALDPEVAATLRGWIEHLNVAALGTLGAVTLLLTAISVLGHIEATFNHVWRVRGARPWWRRLTDYLGVLTLTPILLLVATGMTSFAAQHDVLQRMLDERTIGELTAVAVRALPYVFNAVAVAVLYLVMPNRRPHLPSLLVAAVAAGVCWQLVQVGYVQLQVGVARYNAIYGALAQLPGTLVWLYVSWVIVIAGAELAAVLEYGPGDRRGRPLSDLQVGVEVLSRAMDFFRGLPSACNAPAIARSLGIDVQQVGAVIDRLSLPGWLVWQEGEGQAFLLGRDPLAIDAAAVVALIGDESGGSREASEALNWINEARARALAGRTLAELFPADESAAER